MINDLVHVIDVSNTVLQSFSAFAAWWLIVWLSVIMRNSWTNSRYLPCTYRAISQTQRQLEIYNLYLEPANSPENSITNIRLMT